MNRHGTRLVVAVAALALLAGCGDDPEVRADARGDAPPSVLDRYYGLGRSRPTIVRDDAIASWTAYRQEVRVTECMRASAFEYVPALSYPTEALVEVARSLGVEPAPNPAAAPDERNEAYLASLSGEQRDAYLLRLHGVTAAEFEELLTSEDSPVDAKFDAEGCVAEATDPDERVWSLRDALQPEIEAINRWAADAAAVSYGRCVTEAGGPEGITSPADLETAVLAEDGAKTGGADSTAEPAHILDLCQPDWDRAVDEHREPRYAELLERHAEAAHAHQDRFGEAEGRLREDRGYLDELAQFLGRLAAQDPQG